MEILGKVKIQGKEKQILLKQEDTFFKYYSLELIGAYTPQVGEQKIVFKKEVNLEKKVKIEIINLVNAKITKRVLEIKKFLKLVGAIEIEGKRIELLAKKEEEIIKYYLLNLIGVYTPKIPAETIIFKQDTLENAILSDIKDNAQRSTISLTEKEQIQQFLERVKINDVLERIQTQGRGITQKAKYNKMLKANQKEQKKVEKQQEKGKSEKNISSKKQNKRGDIPIKQEMDMDTRVTDMKNLGQVLQKNKKMPSLEQGDEPLKMGVVESDDLKKLQDEKGKKEQGHTSRYEAVMITKQGKVQSLDLENDSQEGNNPLEKNYQVKQNQSVKNGDVLTRLKVGEGTIGIEKGQYGEVEVYHSPRKTIGGKSIEGNKSLDRQLETSNAKNTLEGTDIETLKLAQEYNDGYRSVEEGYREIAKHEKAYPNCEEKEARDLDGDLQSKSHVHKKEQFIELSTGEKVSYNKLASRWGFYKDGKPDGNFVKEKFEKEKQKDKKPEEVIDELDEEFEDPRRQQGR